MGTEEEKQFRTQELVVDTSRVRLEEEKLEGKPYSRNIVPEPIDWDARVCPWAPSS